jgi:hypothetical protein
MKMLLQVLANCYSRQKNKGWIKNDSLVVFRKQ